jgi:hypothetical protein
VGGLDKVRFTGRFLASARGTIATEGWIGVSERRTKELTIAVAAFAVWSTFLVIGVVIETIVVAK